MVTTMGRVAACRGEDDDNNNNNKNNKKEDKARTGSQ